MLAQKEIEKIVGNCRKKEQGYISKRDLVEYCKEICRTFKKQGVKIPVKDYEIFYNEFIRQQTKNSQRHMQRMTKTEVPIDHRRYDFVMGLIHKTIDHVLLLNNTYFHLSDNPSAKTHVRKSFDYIRHYPTLSYSYDISFDKNWKSNVYDKGLSIVENYIVTHIGENCIINGNTYYSVYYISKHKVNVLKHGYGLLSVDANGNTKIYISLKTFTKEFKDFKLNKAQKQYMDNISGAIKTMNVMSDEKNNINLFNIFQEMLQIKS